jgi:hypothetical protein
MSPPNKIEKLPSRDFGHDGSGRRFSGLEYYKRQDGPASQARRQSLQDMSATPSKGFLANMWNRYVYALSLNHEVMSVLMFSQHLQGMVMPLRAMNE